MAILHRFYCILSNDRFLLSNVDFLKLNLLLTLKLVCKNTVSTLYAQMDSSFLFDAIHLKYHVFENIMENGAFALLE